jgi:tetratricopeptide (TPR) repeat protein
MMLALLLLLAPPPPPGAPPLVDLLARAQRLLQASDHAAARRELGRARQLYPGSPAVYNFLGVLEAEEGSYAGAEGHFREAIARSPDYTDAYLNLGRLYQENAGKDREAPRKGLEVYEALLRRRPEHVEARYQSAALLQALGEFDRSLQELDRLPPADQERPAALAVRLADEAARGERARAEAAGERLRRRADLAAEDVRRALPALLAHGQEGLAQELLQELRSRGLASPDDLRSLLRLLEGESQLVRAREVGEDIAQARPDAVEPLLDLARIAHKAKDYRGALGYLAHARALAPDNARVHFFFGMVCVDLDLGAEAYNSLKEAVRLQPEDAYFNYALGAAAMHRRDPSEAIPYFRKYAQLRPGDAVRGALGAGVAAFKAHDFATARSELASAAARPETAAAAHYFLARIAREENDLDEALRLAQKAVEANPAYADPYAELGLIYVRKRDTAQAEQALRRCLELDPDHYLGNLHLLMLYERTKDARAAGQEEKVQELRRRVERKADEFQRLIEVRPY